MENFLRTPLTGVAQFYSNLNVISTMYRIYHTCTETRLTENVFLLTSARIRTLKYNNVFGLTK